MQTIVGIAVILLAFLPPCWAGSATTDFDPDVDFAQYKTFAIIGGLDPQQSGWLDEPEMHERFKNFVSGALETRGLIEIPVGDKASLVVRFWVARRVKEEVSVIDYGTSYMWGGYPPYWTGAWGYYPGDGCWCHGSALGYVRCCVALGRRTGTTYPGRTRETEGQQ
jgi:hypothetical protein